MVPYEFISSFILGYFDGDGSISINYKKKGWTINITSTLEMCNWIRTHLSQINPGSSGCLHQELRRGDKNVWYIDYGGGFATKKGQFKLQLMYEFLYKKCPISLNRKKDRFTYILSYPSIEKNIRQR
jgi:hypothetical protein